MRARWPMPERVIRGNAIEPDRWQFLGLGGDVVPAQAGTQLDSRLRGNDNLSEGPWAVPLAVWKARRGELRLRPETGVWLQPADDVAELRPDLDALAFVAVHFPKFNEGRGY